MRQLGFFIVAAISLSAISRAYAVSWGDITQFKQPNIRLGQLEIHPYYTIQEAYDSNIYLVPRDQADGVTVGGGVVGSWILKNILGLRLNLPIHRVHHVSMGYDFEAQSYSSQPAANNNLRHRANFLYKFTSAYGISAGAQDAYVNTTDQAFSELIRREKRWQNTAAANVAYAPDNGRMNAAADYADTVHKYLGSALGAALNRSEQSAGLKVGYKAQPKTNIFAAYHRGIVHYSVVRRPTAVDKNNKSHNMDLGVEGDLLANLTGIIKTGLAYRKYDGAPIGGSRVTRDWTFSTQLIYQPISRTTVNLAVSRAFQESTAANNRYYIANDVFLDAHHALPYKLTAGAQFGVAVNKYPEAQTISGLTATRRDDIYTVGASLEYAMQEWLAAGASYTHRERNSNFSGQFNYMDHLTALSLSLKL